MGRIHFSGPNIPAVNAHCEVIGVYHHIAQKPINSQNINENSRADNPRGIYENIILLAEPHAQKAKENADEFQHY